MPGDTVYISIGSNIDPEVHIPKAIRMLHNFAEIEDLCVSSFYVSEAVGPSNQPRYRNGAARLITSLEPDTLRRDILRRIEHDCGRVRKADRYAPRTLDLDIVLFGDRIIATDVMTIPDPAIWEHIFVTIPLLEIAPGLQIPGRNVPLSEMVPTVDPASLSIDDSLNRLIQEGNHYG